MPSDHDIMRKFTKSLLNPMGILLKHRKDIDALRAIAVVTVVAFHFNSEILPGGFAGVDVFFAISGYLMTSIISKGISNQNFSVISFYASRCRRILPALSVLCISLVIFGWFRLAPLDYLQLIKHSLSSMLFISNFIYWGESGYFDLTSHEKWLLHTWSLSAEWQFYLVYPIAMILLSKLIKSKNIGISLILFGALSFFFGLYSSIHWPTASYFLLPSRAWEMVFGGIAFFLQNKIRAHDSKKLHYLGLLLIFTSVFIVSSEDVWPGYMALLPVIGAVCYLTANHDGYITKLKPVILIGRWSYSIYLWHWPVVVYCYLNKIEMGIIVGLIISIIFGFLSYELVEKRRSNNLLFVPVFSLVMCFAVFANGGYAFQMPIAIYNTAMMDPSSKDYGDFTWKNIKKINTDFDSSDDNRKVLIIGDSMAADFVNVLYSSAVINSMQLRSRLVPSDCASFFLDQSQRDELYKVSWDIRTGRTTKALCDNEIEAIYSDEIVKQADVIIVAMSWREYALPFIRESIDNLRKVSSAKIVLIGNKNFSDRLPRIIYKAYYEKKDAERLAFDYSNLQFKISDQLRLISNEYKLVQFIDIKDKICNRSEGVCTAFYDKFPIIYDDMHATKKGIQFIKEKIESDISKI